MDHCERDDDLAPPPSSPPPLLSEAQILSLAQTGSLPLPLPPHLRQLYTQLNSLATKFFSLPLNTKQDSYAPINGTELGYVSIPAEKEYISFRALTAHAAESELERTIAAVWRETYTFLYRILCDLAWAMDISHEVWDRVLDGISPMPKRLEEATPTFLRVFRYEPNTGIAESHADLGLLTLCVGDGQGLQVRVGGANAKEQWAEYQEPTLLVGKTLAKLSGGRIKPGVHRVVGNTAGRNSIVYALRPSTKHEIELGMFPGVRAPVHMGELWKSVWQGAFNVNAPLDVREKQKERQRLMKQQERTGTGGEDDFDQTNTLSAITG